MINFSAKLDIFSQRMLLVFDSEGSIIFLIHSTFDVIMRQDPRERLKIFIVIFFACEHLHAKHEGGALVLSCRVHVDLTSVLLHNVAADVEAHSKPVDIHLSRARATLIEESEYLAYVIRSDAFALVRHVHL